MARSPQYFKIVAPLPPLNDADGLIKVKATSDYKEHFNYDESKFLYVIVTIFLDERC